MSVFEIFYNPGHYPSYKKCYCTLLLQCYCTFAKTLTKRYRIIKLQEKREIYTIFYDIV